MVFVEDDIHQVVAGIWTSVLGLELGRRSGPVRFAEPTRFLTGCVQISGRWEGAVTLDCSPALARRTAAIMFGLDPDAASHDEVRDALGELANMTGGNIKGLLPGPCRLSLPAVIEGTDYQVSVPHGRVLTQLAFDCEGEPLQVTVFEGSTCEGA